MIKTGARTKGQSPLIRRGLLLHEGATLQLDELRESTEAGSDSEVIRKALIYFAQLWDDYLDQYRLISRDNDDIDSIVSISPGDEKHFRLAGESLVKRNLIIHERTARRLDTLKHSTQASSDSELVRTAISVYYTLVENTLAGKRLTLKHIESGRERELVMPVSRSKPMHRRIVDFPKRMLG